MSQSNKKMCSRVIAAIEGTPWAIVPDALERIIAIANRSYSNPALAASIKAEYLSQTAHIASDDEKKEVVIIDVMGPIFTHADMFLDISGACSLESLQHRLDAALYDDDVKSIILQLDSPGGQVTGVHEFVNYLREACEIKPIVAYVSGMAASAAYWIASATSRIYADRTTLIGSLGVVVTWTDNSKSRGNAGLVDYEIVSSQSPKKRLSPATEEGRSDLQKNIDGLADIFIDDVARFRGVSIEKVIADFGQGGTYLAEEAIKNGMADEVSSLREVINILSAENKQLGFNNSMGDKISMGAKAKQDKLNFSLKETGEEPEKKELEDIDEDENDVSLIEDDENEGDLENEDESSAGSDPLDEEDDDKESIKTKKAISAFSLSHPNLYQAVVARGARKERNRIKGIEALGIAGHQKLIFDAKYKKPKSVAATSLAILNSEKKIRQTLAANYQEDGSFAVPITNTASGAAGSKAAADDTSFLKHVAAGAMAALGVKK